MLVVRLICFCNLTTNDVCDIIITVCTIDKTVCTIDKEELYYD